MAREVVVQGPLPKEFSTLVEETTTLDYFDALPRVPAPEALEAAKLGMKLFSEASEAERIELPGTLA